MILEIGERTRIEVMRWSISSVVESAAPKKKMVAPVKEDAVEEEDEAPVEAEVESAVVEEAEENKNE